MPHNENPDKGRLILLTVGAITIVLLVWLASWFFISQRFPVEADRGTFGDMFGAVNSLFSGLAFAILIIAIYLQSKELALQRQELQQTRLELEGQKEQLQAQNESLKSQTDELVYQRNLSLMPLITAHFDTALSLKLINIGNGTAINISIDDLPITFRGTHAIVKFGRLFFLEPPHRKSKVIEGQGPVYDFESTVRVVVELPEELRVTMTVEEIRRIVSFQVFKENGGETLTLGLRYQDIDNNRYLQEIVFRIGARPYAISLHRI